MITSGQCKPAVRRSRAASIAAHWSGGLVLLAALLMVTLPAASQGLGGLFGSGNDTGDILDVEDAFPVTVSQPDEATLAVAIDIQDGYYLYQQSLGIEVDDRALATAAIDFPPGRIKEDEFFGRQRVYTQPVTLTATLPASLSDGAPVTVRLQGCADSGVCYPPYTVSTTASGQNPEYAINPGAPAITADAAEGIPGEGNGDSADAGGGNASVTGDATAQGGALATSAGGEAGRLGQLLSNASLPAVLGGFFAAGILLAFTACLYPMIPILSGLIAGDPHRSGSLRALGLSLVYVESTAITYSLAGVAAGMTGAAVQADLQSPWVLGSFAALFAILALGMFGVFEFRMPAGLQTRLTLLSNRQRGGTLIGVAIMGVLSTLIVGACSGPALIAALVFIGSTGDAWLGGLALFALANGMGLPLLLIGTAAGRWLPKSGPWMDAVRAVFGVGFLAVALWLLERFLPGPVTLALWGILLVGCGVWLGAPGRLEAGSGARQRLARTLGVVALIWGSLSLIGAAAGGGDVLRPLAGVNLAGGSGTLQAESGKLAFRDIDSVADLDTALADARAAGRPVMIDIYADWCVYCVQLEQRTFTDPRVHEAVASAALLRADVTDMTADHRALMRRLNVYLPPAIIFYGPDGRENRDVRVVGFLEPAAFIERARAGLAGG